MSVTESKRSKPSDDDECFHPAQGKDDCCVGLRNTVTVNGFLHLSCRLREKTKSFKGEKQNDERCIRSCVDRIGLGPSNRASLEGGKSHRVNGQTNAR
jgi:hypothetical protein